MPCRRDLRGTQGETAFAICRLTHQLRHAMLPQTPAVSLPVNQVTQRKLPVNVRIAVLVYLLIGGQANADEFTAKVIGVTDGDTIVVLSDIGVERIRLLGIDCPEKKQPFSEKASQLTAARSFGKVVKIQYTKLDRYGRVLGEVILPDGSSLSQELVRLGLAWHYVQYSSSPVLDRLENEARKNRKGLWQDRAPIPPWDWRKGLR
jgi:micrococcal nuclease